MPNPLLLKINDLLRFTAFPDEWSRPDIHIPRECKIFMIKMIRRTWPSRVSRFDDSGYPWIDAIIRERGKLHYHAWLITESSGWRQVQRRIPPSRKLNSVK